MVWLAKVERPGMHEVAKYLNAFSSPVLMRGGKQSASKESYLVTQGNKLTSWLSLTFRVTSNSRRLGAGLQLRLSIFQPDVIPFAYQHRILKWKKECGGNTELTLT